MCYLVKHATFRCAVIPGWEWARCDQMGELDNSTFLESSDHVDNEKKLFFSLLLGQQVSSGNFVKIVKDI